MYYKAIVLWKSKTSMENILLSWLLLLSNLVHRNKINKQAKEIIINSLAAASRIKVSKMKFETGVLAKF